MSTQKQLNSKESKVTFITQKRVWRDVKKKCASDDIPVKRYVTAAIFKALAMNENELRETIKGLYGGEKKI